MQSRLGQLAIAAMAVVVVYAILFVWWVVVELRQLWRHVRQKGKV